MSDTTAPLSAAPLADISKQLDALDGQIKGMENIITGLNALGRDTTDMQRVLTGIKESRRILGEAIK